MSRVMMKVGRGALSPADAFAAERLRERRYKIGDVVAVEIKKARNPRFHRLAHQIGTLVIQNIEEFAGYDAHHVLKRLQLESGVGCEETAIKVAGLGMVMHRTPRSLSYESMDDAEFHAVVSGLCNHIVKQYWPGLEPDEIERMAEAMVDV